MQEDWLFHTSRARELRERDRDKRWWADKAKLPRKPRLLVDTLVDLFPHIRGNPPAHLSEVEIDDMLIDRLKVTHPRFTFKRTTLSTALKFVREGKLPQRRVRTNTNSLRTSSQ
jgi:hypothetical protein